MVRIGISPRKKRVTWLDQIQAEASRRRASYTPPPLDDAGTREVHQPGSRETKTSESQQDGGGRLWSTSPPFLHGGSKETTPTRQSSSAHAQEETRQTKNLPDPDGTGKGFFQDCVASVFSSQTIDLLFLGGTGPSQQTESDPVAIKGPHTPSDEHPPSPRHYE